MSFDSTMFAPSERAGAESILRDAELLRPAAFAEQAMALIPSILMVLNRQRQVVYANQRLMDFLGVATDQGVLGRRPGELFGCIHACENDAGCGTTEFCRECGAAKAILGSQSEGSAVTDECRIVSTSGEAYDLRVSATPCVLENRQYTMFVVEDIQQEKRRHALERRFFHDVNHILRAMTGGTALLRIAEDKRRVAEYADAVDVAARQLVEEIASHRSLLQAENGELSACISLVDPLELMRDVVELSTANADWLDRDITVGGSSGGVEVETDRALLHRVLAGMLRNALEATPDGEEVHLACKRERASMVFSVHNAGHMPRSVQLQVFQRSFSTKGKGRGVGTYSMKLFGERYLRGKVWFSASESEGTTFFISVPINYDDA